MLNILSESECGIPLGVGSVLTSQQVDVSSKDTYRGKQDTALYGDATWCALTEDEQPFMQV